MIRGIRNIDSAKDSDAASGPKNKMKEIYKNLDESHSINEVEDKDAEGAVESGGSFFNAFKPRNGVTIMEGLAKMKKGENFRKNAGNLTRMEYSKTYSQKPFEPKGILSNSQSLGVLGAPKKSQGISFYEESTLPPIMSPRTRYRVENENDVTQEFELDQSEIPPVKKNEEVIIKTGDITELVAFDKNLLNDTNDISHLNKTDRKTNISILPKYVNK